jgi:PAT family beta-lactamase induction signal transducer AmpG
LSIFSGDFAVLSEHRRWRFVVFLMLYVAQGIPFGLIAIALPAYMAQQGVDALTISAFLGFCLLPHAIKLVNGPIMDRWTYWPMGKRRPWVLIAQCILVTVFASLALVPDPLNNMGLLTVACFTLNFFVGFQDVATDGMAVDVLPVEDQPKASSIMFGGSTVSMAITAAVGGWALSRYGIGVPSVVCACIIALVSGFLLISRERVGERLLPWTEGRATIDPLVHRPEGLKEIGLDLKKFVLLRASLFAIAASAIYQFGRGIFLTMMPLYYVQELGWTDTEYSGLTGTAMFMGGAISILFGGLILDFLGRVRAFQILCAAAAVLGAILAVAPGLGDIDSVMKIYRVLYMILDTLIIVAFISVAMAICAREVAATQFAIYMALGNVGYTAGSAAYGPISAALSSYEATFFVFAAVTVTAIFAMRRVSIADHAASVKRLQADGVKAAEPI